MSQTIFSLPFKTCGSIFLIVHWVSGGKKKTKFMIDRDLSKQYIQTVQNLKTI